MSPPLMVTEDTPPDMLAGAMDLRLVLPSGSRVRMSVDRRTPMMDLLVQVTTAYKITPGGHVLQPYGESGLLPYKPSTPIGALDTWTVHIVPKNQALQNPANKISLKQVIQPFEQTFRFQVNLPRNQLYVTRVNGRTTMVEILEQACKEKGLDTNKYTLKHPKQLDGLSLCEDLSVAEYGHNQVTMVSRRAIPPSSVSTEDILAMHKYFNSSKSCESSSRSLSPDSSVSPKQPVQPSRPIRKRRPAPKPPIPAKQQTLSLLEKQSSGDSCQQKESTSNGPVICHSRTSSDSSGYHEASVLSESPDSNNSSLPDSLPRRSKLPSNHEPSCSGTKQKLSRSLSNLHQASTSSAMVNSMLPSNRSVLKPAQSTSSLAPSRKKKPAPPPPVFSIAEEREETLSTASRTCKTLPAGTRLPECQTPNNTPQSPPVDMLVECPEAKPISPAPSRILDCVDNVADNTVPRDDPAAIVDSSDASSIVTPSETDRIEAEIERMFEQATREHVSLESGVDLGESPERLPSPPSQSNKIEEVELDDDPFMDWEYKLPAPPTFRDETSSPPLTEYSTMTVGKMKEVLFESTNNNRTADSAATFIDELSNAVVDRKVLRPQSSTQLSSEGTIPSNLDNFHITTYNGQPEKSIGKRSSEKDLTKCTNVQVVQNNLETKIENSPKLIMENKNEFKTQPDISNSQNNIKEKSTEKIYSNGTSSIFINDIHLNKPSQMKIDSVANSLEKVTKQNENIYEINDKNFKKNKKNCLLDKDCKERNITSVIRTSSFVQDRRPQPVKRSVSYVSCLTKARMNLSKSNSDLLESSEEENNTMGPDQQITLHLRPVAKSNLRKTSSEISINREATDNKILSKQESGLQSLQVLRSILPQISQSQGSMNTVGLHSNDVNIKEQTSNFVRPSVSVSTWGERPKRQVSIKSDRDYVFGQKVILKPISQVVKTTVPPQPQPKPLLLLEKRNKPSVYKTLETGNTKPIKLQHEQSTSQQVQNNEEDISQIKITTGLSSSSRLPVVRSVELKKPYQLRQQEPLQQQQQQQQQQQRSVPCYLFGCEPTIPDICQNNTNNNNNIIEKKFTSIVGINQTPTPPPPPPAVIHLKPASKRGPLPPAPSSDPREELLQSIRSFGGRDSLRKVSTR